MRKFRPFFALVALGLAAGFAGGLAGAGGGFLLVRFLSRRVRGEGATRTVFATVPTVMLPLAAAGTRPYLAAGNVALSAWLFLLPFAFAGGVTGAFLLGRVTPRLLRGLFGALILFSGVMLLCR